MANVFFVSHPYNPPTNVKGNICRWNTGCEHWRKLLRSQGARYITGLGASPDEGDIVFVGEWECCSECAPCPTNDTRLGCVDSKTIFADIANKVTAKGYCLGVRMPMPKKRTICNILK